MPPSAIAASNGTELSTKGLRERAWALVLAGGDGTRLQPLTRRIAGAPIPKQYCRIVGDRSLLEATLARIFPLVPRERTLVVVNRSHLQLALPQLLRAAASAGIRSSHTSVIQAKWINKP